MSEIEKQVEDLKQKVESLDNRRQWVIAVASAILAMIASIVSAVISYESIKYKADADNQIARDKHVISVFSKFGEYVVKGEPKERCTALLLIGTIEPICEIKERSKELSRQLRCEGVVEALSAPEGQHCSQDARITMTTQRNLSGSELDEAKSMCVAGISIPKKFDGPWADGSVSFYFGNTNKGSEVWCNCSMR